MSKTAYARTYQLQEDINRHQELVHARPHAVKAGGFTQDTMFPKGFLFRTRYKWLVLVLAAELESGSRQLDDEQLMWIERRWRRHGVFTVTVADARKDAARWIAAGGKGEPPAFFDDLTEFAGDFTESLGEGMPLGAFATAIDPEQEDLNLAHLVGLGLVGAPVFPEIMAYIFTDRSKPEHLFTMVTDEPAVMGTKTDTGLLNGMCGATLECIGVRPATSWETKMADGRHLFYHLTRSRARTQLQCLAETASLDTLPDWEMADFVDGLKKVSPDTLHSYNRGLAATLAETFSLETRGGCGIDYEPMTDSYFRNETIQSLAGRIDFEGLKQLFKLATDLVWTSEHLSDTTVSTYRALLSDIKDLTKGDWSLLSGENDAGKSLRASIRLRLKKAMFGVEKPSTMESPQLKDYQFYLDCLKEAAALYVQGRLNTALLTRLAFIVRTEAICPKDAEEYTAALCRLLGIRSREPLVVAA